MAGKGPDITYTRGDTVAKQMTLTKAGAAFDLTGLVNMEIVVNSEDEPATAANEQFRMPVTIVAPATNGIVEFQPAGVNVAARKVISDAYVPGDYFYDFQVDDAAGERITLLLAGKFTVQQDINKA